MSDEPKKDEQVFDVKTEPSGESLPESELEQGAGGAGGAGGRTQHGDFSFTKFVDVSSPLLEVAPTLAQSAAAAGELSGSELNNVVGGGTKTQAPAKGPTESISLNFPKINLEY
jgi:type VI protein secretion system component Hcp